MNEQCFNAKVKVQKETPLVTIVTTCGHSLRLYKPEPSWLWVYTPQKIPTV